MLFYSELLWYVGRRDLATEASDRGVLISEVSWLALDVACQGLPV